MTTAPTIVVVGAGLSGLVCARRLEQGGADVAMVEARDEVGGRTKSGILAGRVVDLGGQWMSAGQPRLAALATEVGVATFGQNRVGRAVEARAADEPWRAPVVSSMRLARRLRELRDVCAQVSYLAPGSAVCAAEWDRMSVAEWMEQRRFDGRSAATVTQLTRLKFAAEPRELSLLFFAGALAACGGLDEPVPFSDGSSERCFVGGAQQLCTRLAGVVRGRLYLGEPVTRIRCDAEAVEVVTSRRVLRADRVVLAVPPQVSTHLEFDPICPRARQALLTASSTGPVIKWFVSYAVNFWRDAGLSGEAYGVGRIAAVLDASDVSEDAYALTGMIIADNAHAMSSLHLDERRAIVLTELVELFGAQAAHATDYVEHDWALEPWSRGAVFNIGKGHFRAGPGCLREPWARIHLAGTEAATRWPRYMEGAVEAGERAAAEILALT